MHSEWLECSKCGNKQGTSYAELYDTMTTEPEHAVCPHCGGDKWVLKRKEHEFVDPDPSSTHAVATLGMIIFSFVIFIIAFISFEWYHFEADDFTCMGFYFFMVLYGLSQCNEPTK